MPWVQKTSGSIHFRALLATAINRIWTTHNIYESDSSQSTVIKVNREAILWTCEIKLWPKNTESLMNRPVCHCAHFVYTSWLLGNIFTARFQSTVTNLCIFEFVTFYKIAELLRSLSVEFFSHSRIVVHLQLKPIPALLPQPNLRYQLLPFTVSLWHMKALVVTRCVLLKIASYWTEPSF